MPKISMPGAVIDGDAGGMVDTVALKGVHHAITSGMLAANTIYEALRRGERVVDMQHFLLERQRAEITRLKTQHRILIATTRANLTSQSRIHGAVLALLAAASFEQLIQIVTTDLAVLLDADVVTLVHR